MRYTLSTIILEHTHTLSPRKARYFRCNRKMDPVVKKQFDVGDSTGINRRVPGCHVEALKMEVVKCTALWW
ncbi:hypothetical protein CIPAW_01G174300 [Carya illinoinensis]|uniref:Uncharacterized protein n=1 Tax=Carya illinoinensis TaxID=32201 RepID=A0A8T1RR18_CARIL|nr:hypothetical protein CIPAW_01G174300 [Carya illinoinensis]